MEKGKTILKKAAKDLEELRNMWDATREYTDEDREIMKLIDWNSVAVSLENLKCTLKNISVKEKLHGRL